MNKPRKPRKPHRFVFPPQEKIYYEQSHWQTSSRGGYCFEDPVEKAVETWCSEDDPAEHWKICSLNSEGYVSLAKAVKIAKEKGIPLEDIHFGLFIDEDHIRASLFTIEEGANPHYHEMVKDAESQEKRYQRELEQYEEEMEKYPLKLKQYLEHQKQEAEQKLRELERE